MVDLQSCESLMKASSLCAIEQEVEGESTNHADTVNILAELNTEKQKNTELRERILILEAQIDDRDHTDGLQLNEQGSCLTAGERRVKIFRRQKIKGQSSDKIDNEDMPTNTETAGPVPIKHPSLKNRLVNWMSKDNTQCFIERSHDDESIDNCADTDETNDTGDQIENTAHVDNEPDELLEGEATYHHMKQEPSNNQTRIRLLSDRKAKKSSEGYQVPSRIFTSSQDLGRSSNTVIQRRPQKVAFCPKEVRRIIELELLQHKNAQSHTIRKIIVFASLGVRHGCEDMYELDFNHFSILRKGEPFVSMKNPGEHVLYENPGVRKKVFYPNRQIPMLCPVNILEEEKAMRPLDAGCPSCLFLCIKYGGRTRNLPQNEYVRQRMGRNKLKSFGPLICRMAMLVHNRDGSFFFKALGITLLFMAGFPDDLVQNETKYRNLDLLQKYYRRDEDAEGEELFLTRPIACDTDANPSTEHMTEKTSFRKSKGKKKYTSSTIKSQNSEKSIILRSTPLSSAPPAKHTSKDYTSIPSHSIMYQTMPPQSPANTPLTSNPVIQNFGPNIFYQNQSSYPLIPPFPSTSFVPMMYWPPTTTFPPCYFPSSYPQLYYNNALCNTLTPRFAEGKRRKNAASSVSDHSDCNSSSSRKSRREK